MPMPQRAQAGDETARQLNVGAEILDQLNKKKSFADYLRDKRISATELVQPGGSVDNAEQELRNFSDIAPGRNPIERASALNQFGTSTSRFISDVYSSENQVRNEYLDLLFGIQEENRKQEAFELEKAELSKGVESVAAYADMTPEQVGKAGLTGSAALLEVESQGGKFLLDRVSKNDRADLAEEILRNGGVNAWRKEADLEAIIDEKESDSLVALSQMQSELLRGLSAFKNIQGGIFGSGPLAQFIPSALRTKEGREAMAFASSITAEKLRQISGATVSDREVERLSAFLPGKGKTEKQNIEDIQRLINGININLEIFEAAKREGLTATEALNKYGQVIFERNEERWPYTSQSGGKKTSSGFTIEQVE